MNRYPIWKNVLIAAIVLICGFYALPNLFGEDPAVQISPGYAREAEVTEEVLNQALAYLKEAQLSPESYELDTGRALLRFSDTDAQLKAYSVLQEKMPGEFVVAQNLAPATPGWMSALNARPMYLGLDLRGGVHFLMEVDMATAIRQDEEQWVDEFRTLLRENRIYHRGLRRLSGGGVEISFAKPELREQAGKLIEKEYPELRATETESGEKFNLVWQYTEEALREARGQALQQNITTLRNRVNELGVAEPVIQQQGEDRIVVQLPGVQDTAKAKEILRSTATLEFRLVSEEGPNARKYQSRDRGPVWLKRSVIVTGDHIVNAASGMDQRSGSPAVHVTLDGKGGNRMYETTKENVSKPMAVVFIEHTTETRVIDGKPQKVREKTEEVISVATIQEPFGRRFQVTGLSHNEAVNLALLLRAGALKAPVEIVEERTIGPSLGKENIEQGFLAIVIGFMLITIFMYLRYGTFGLIADVAMTVNLIMLVGLLSILQATLTLPGIAGILLTIGMAIDANVLIFERIREEVLNRNSPQSSIHSGFEKAFGTILDANVTTLIAGVVLFSFGTGPVKGFAVTLSLGIMTSMFTAILVSRALINFIYGGKRLDRLPL